jgi:hypothetical protein
MITMQEAVQIALTNIRSLLAPLPPNNLRVEEIERSTDDNWQVTIGYDTPGRGISSFGPNISSRDYKTFKIRAEDGEIISMKIRSIG